MFDGLAQAAGSVLSTGMGLIAANHGAYKQYKYNSKLQAQAAKLNYDYGIKSLKNSPSAQREGLETAGYNPMLAVQNSTSGANAGWTSNSSVEAPDYAGAISSGIANAQSFQRLKNETETTESQVEANEATAENQRAEASNKRAQNPYISKQAEAELGKTSAETAKLQSDTEYNSALIENMRSRLELDRALGFAGLDVQRRGQDKALYGTIYNADTLKDIADRHQPSGRSSSFQNYTGGVRNLMSGVGDIIHGRQDTYENYDESVQHSSRDKRTGVTTTTKSRRTGRRKK